MQRFDTTVNKVFMELQFRLLYTYFIQIILEVNLLRWETEQLTCIWKTQ